jgi:tetratricopeptide (TPR) repeat protein
MEPQKMMKRKNFSEPFGLTAIAVSLLGLPVATSAQSAPTAPAAKAGDAAQATPDRAHAYYHAALAGIYEEQAVNTGQSQFVAQAIEQYKSALNADPTSPSLNDALADLYFRVGKARDAEATARNLLKTSPDDLEAHKLLGRVYLRQLSEAQNAVSSTTPSGNVLDQAIAVFQKFVSLEPKDVESRMVLGQLYTVAHKQDKAEEQFKTAQAIDPDSEEVVLNLARLYVESGDMAHAAKVIEAVPQDSRTAKMELALGAAYDQMKRPKDAIAAYKRGVELEPSDPRGLNALAQALTKDEQYDEALKVYHDLSEVDPDDPNALIHAGEILYQQGKYEDSLVAIRKALKKDPDNLEAGYNLGMTLDVLGRYDEAGEAYGHMVELTSHANGAYTAEEKKNRAIFLERLAAVYHEQNKTEQAVATYQKMIDLGGEAAVRGYQGQIDTWRDAKKFDKAVETAKKAADANPKSQELKLILADQMVDVGKADDAIALTKTLLTNSDKDRAVWLEVAQIATRVHRWKDAEEALNKAQGLTTKDEDRVYLLFLRGALIERQKRYEAAEPYFKQALELDPTNAMVLNYYGYMLADKGMKLPEAVKLIRKAVEQEPMNGAYLDSLGWAYFKMGQYELAEENLRQAVERTQTDPTVHEHLGDLYEKTGRIRLAAAQWQLSLTEFARSAAADVEPSDVAKLQKKLEGARVKLAKEDSRINGPKTN